MHDSFYVLSTSISTFIHFFSFEEKFKIFILKMQGIEKSPDAKLEGTKTVDDRYDPIKQLDPLYSEKNSN